MRDFLDKASDAYYQGNPFISDAEFDILSAHFNYAGLGHQVTNGIPHYIPMYSLQNCFDLKDAPVDINHCVQTPKLDGAAISILYVNNKLVLALTRGDGTLGRDITEKVKTLVPHTLGTQKLEANIIQVTGEVIASSSIPNSRNYAAGALNLKDLNEFRSREVRFVAYDVLGLSFKYWDRSMVWLEEEGFDTVLEFDTIGYPTDGVVYRINDNSVFNEMGYTRKHPRGAFALKEKKEGVETTLRDVIWQVGRSGAVSPVAILAPVKVEDAVVSRATLHNIAYIRGLDLEIGCKVEVIRAGEIIPRVVRRIN